MAGADGMTAMRFSVGPGLLRPGLLRPGMPAVASLLVNGLLLALLLTMGAVRQERVLDRHPLNVLSLAALKGSEAGEESAATAEPADTSPPPSHAVKPPAPPTPPVPPAAMAPPQPLPSLPLQMARPAAVRPSVAVPASSSPAVASAAAPASVASAALSSRQGAPPPRRGTAEGLDTDAPAGKSMAYAARVRTWLYAHKLYPRRALMRKEEGVVRVRFIIDRAGVLLEGLVIGSSGKASLDEEAQAMMHRASPFPSAPAAILGERIEFTAPIEFVLPV